jgi:RNA polymerase sigma-70 factor (sigma-E family)
MRAEDEAEFAELVVVLSHRLHRLAFAVCGDRPLAEDAVQSALVSVYRTWPRVRDADSPEAYLRTMVVNQLLSWRRRKSWGTESPLSGGPVEPSRASHEDVFLEQQRIWSALADLPARRRAVIVLRYYEDMTEADIAQTLGIRPGTVKSQASAAMAQLRTALGDPDPKMAARPLEGGEVR